MRTLEVRRHAQRDPEADRLSEEGARGPSPSAPRSRRVRGRVHLPAQRAAETVAWFLRGLGEQLGARRRAGLAAEDNDGSPLAMAGVLSALLDAVPEDGRGLAVSHTPDRARGARALGPRDRAARRVRGRPAVQDRGRVTGRDRGAPPPELIRGPVDPSRGLRPRRRARRVARTGPAPAVLRGLAWRRPSRAARDGRRERYLRRVHAAARRRAVVARAERDVPARRPGDRRGFLVFLAVDALRRTAVPRSSTRRARACIRASAASSRSC